MGKPPRNKETASAYIGLGGHRIDPEILKARIAERDARQMSDHRSDIVKYLGDPPTPMQSATAQVSRPAPRRIAGQRVDLWKTKPR
jgi:hypothetical protein